MLDSNQVKEKLTVDDIIKICCDLQGDDNVYYDAKGNPMFNTCIDHDGGDSYKLVYYDSTKLFHCYTRGTTKDLFEIVQYAKGFESFIDAFQYVVQYFHLKNTGFEAPAKLTSDWDIFQFVKDKESVVEEVQNDEVKVINENMLEYFYPMAAPYEWKKEGIAAEVMYQYGIRIDSALHHIIIPQRNIKGELIGIRRRSFDPFEVAAGKKYMPVFIEGDVYATPTSKTLFGIYENQTTIRKLKRVLLVEGEKSVMQLATMYGQNNCWALACYGSSLSSDHIKLLLELGVEEVVLGFDREFNGSGVDKDILEYKEKLYKVVKPLLPYMRVAIIMDTDHLTQYKDSPTDRGKEIFEKLYHARRYVQIPENNVLKKQKKRR